MGVGQVAVMRDGEPTELEIGIQRLDVAQDRFAGGGIAVVADGDAAGQLLDDPGIAEIVADQTHAAVRMEAGAVEAGDPSGFLSAMLQGVQPQRGDGRGIRDVPDSENATLLMQRVVVTRVVSARTVVHVPAVRCHL